MGFDGPYHVRMCFEYRGSDIDPGMTPVQTLCDSRNVPVLDIHQDAIISGEWTRDPLDWYPSEFAIKLIGLLNCERPTGFLKVVDDRCVDRVVRFYPFVLREDPICDS